MKKSRLINNRRRPVTSVPHAGNQHCLAQTGLSFDGVHVALVVPPGMHPPEVVATFVRDWKRMYRRSKMTTLHDIYQHVFRELSDG